MAGARRGHAFQPLLCDLGERISLVRRQPSLRTAHGASRALRAYIGFFRAAAADSPPVRINAPREVTFNERISCPGEKMPEEKISRGRPLGVGEMIKCDVVFQFDKFYEASVLIRRGIVDYVYW